jgi:hypothetical protein
LIWLDPFLANKFGQLNYQITSPLVVKPSPIQSQNIEIKTRGKFRDRYISPINPGEPFFETIPTNNLMIN